MKRPSYQRYREVYGPAPRTDGEECPKCGSDELYPFNDGFGGFELVCAECERL